MKYSREELKILHDESKGSWVLKVVDTNSTLVRFPDRRTVEEIADLLIKDDGMTVPSRENSYHMQDQLMQFNIDLARAC